jgi:hypothetical protein
MACILPSYGYYDFVDREGVLAMAKECALTYDDLSAVFDYDPQTGRITWKTKAGRGMRPGDEAGSVKSLRTNSRDGNVKQYRYVTYDGYSMTAARVAWLLTHREWPKRNILFVNEDTLDTRLENLRLGDRVSGDSNGPLANNRMNKHIQQAYGLQRNYGLSLEEYARMLHAQNYVCAICEQPEVRLGNDGKPVALHVDHDHKTGKVRGLLCYKCNSGLGSFNEDTDLMRRAAEFLKHHKRDEPGEFTRKALSDAVEMENIIPFNPGEAS